MTGRTAWMPHPDEQRWEQGVSAGLRKSGASTFRTVQHAVQAPQLRSGRTAPRSLVSRSVSVRISPEVLTSEKEDKRRLLETSIGSGMSERLLSDGRTPPRTTKNEPTRPKATRARCPRSSVHVRRSVFRTPSVRGLVHRCDDRQGGHYRCEHEPAASRRRRGVRRGGGDRVRVSRLASYARRRLLHGQGASATGQGGFR